MHLSTLSLGASNCVDGPLFVCVEKRGSPAPSIAGCMPEHPGGILKRLRHAQGMEARELGAQAFTRAEVSMNWAFLWCARTRALMIVNGRQH
jgi:hypothetical protein